MATNYDNSHLCFECTGAGCKQCNFTGEERFPLSHACNNAKPPAIAQPVNDYVVTRRQQVDTRAEMIVVKILQDFILYGHTHFALPGYVPHISMGWNGRLEEPAAHLVLVNTVDDLRWAANLSTKGKLVEVMLTTEFKKRYTLQMPSSPFRTAEQNEELKKSYTAKWVSRHCK